MSKRCRHLLLLALVASWCAAGAHAASVFLKARLDGPQAGVATTADGSAFFTYDTVTRALTWTVNYRNLSSAINAAHIHGPAGPGVSAGIQVPFATSASPLVGNATISAPQEADMLAGLWYVNIHSDNFPLGEIRGQISSIDTLAYKVPLDGAQAGTPGSPIATPGSGNGTVTFDPATLQLGWNITYSNLTSPANAAHFHGPAVAFEVAGIRQPTNSVSPITGSFVLPATFAAELVNGFWYFNIHTGNFPNGEIRGQVIPKTNQTIAFTNPGSQAFTLAPLALSATATSGLAVSFTSLTPAVCTVSGSILAMQGGGTCILRADQAGDDNFNAAPPVAQSFEIILPVATRLVGISTRAQVLTGDNVMIGGFIIGGATPKTVVVRARGPSLGVAGALLNPVLTLVPSNGTPSTTNDDWQSAANQATLAASGFAPGDARESAILTTLDPGAYTAIVGGVGNTTGVSLVEVFELDHPEVPLAAISTRGFVQTADNVMIGGFIIQGSAPQTVVIRARGPSLGVAGALLNPVLTLVPADGSPVTVNDDWQTAANYLQLSASGFAPGDPRESALLITLNPGAYTAIVSGVGGTTGVAIVEVYAQ